MTQDSLQKSFIQTEQMLLGALILNQVNLEKIEFLKAEHFSVNLHQEIFKALLRLSESNVRADHTAIYNILKNNRDLQECGGLEYLSKILSLSIMIVDVTPYAKQVRDFAVKKELVQINQEAIDSINSSSFLDDPITQIENIENKLSNLYTDQVFTKGFVHSNEIVLEVIENINKAVQNPGAVLGTPTGFIDLDNKLGGFHNSDLIVLAARPGMGKTAFALNLAVNAAQQLCDKGLSVGFFSLEMSATDLMSRIISMKAKVNSSCFLTGKIGEENYNKIREVISRINTLPLYIEDSAALTIASIRSRAKKLKRRFNLGILFIDYLQLMKCTEKVESRLLEVSEISRSLKALAKELNIPIIALSQLSRAVEQRADKRPILSDLRESGSIEQDADLVILLYREEYYLKMAEAKQNTLEYQEWVEKVSKVHNSAELIIAKHRKGPTGNIKLYYNDKYSQFGNIVSNKSLKQ